MRKIKNILVSVPALFLYICVVVYAAQTTITSTDTLSQAWVKETANNTDLQNNINGKADVLGADDNYVTDAEKAVIGNTTGTNSGNQVGDGVTITGTGTGGDPFVSAGGGGSGDVTESGDNTFTGENDFQGATTIGALGNLIFKSGDYKMDSGTISFTGNALLNVGNYDVRWPGEALIGTDGLLEDGIVEADKLESTNTASDNQIYTFDSATGGGTWEDQTGGVQINDASDSSTTETWSIDRIKLYVNEVIGFPSIAVTTPATDGTWLQNATYTSLAGTASDGGTVSTIDWKLESGGTYATTNVSGTTAWIVSSITLAENVNNVYVRATDNDTNATETIRVINVDTTLPVIVAAADTTHDGSTPFTSTAVLTETNIADPAITYTATNATPGSGSCTGTYPNYSTPSLTPTGTSNCVITYASTDLAGNAATGTRLGQNINYAAPSTDLFSWSCGSLTAETFDVDDGGTIVPASDGVPSHSFVSGEIQFDSGTWASVPATNGNNINYGAGTVEFDFTLASGTSTNSHRIFAAGDTDQLNFLRSSAGETRYGMWIAGSAYYEDTAENLYDGSKHHVIITWDCSAQTASFQIDSSTYNVTLGSTTVPTNDAGSDMYFNGRNNSSSQLQVRYDNVEVR